MPASSPIWGAVDETAGQVLLWEGAVFPAFYHTESGGYTEDPRMIFAARNLPALTPVGCDFSAGSPHFFCNLDLSLAAGTDPPRQSHVDRRRVSQIPGSGPTP